MMIMSDERLALTFDELGKLVPQARPVAAAVGRTH